MDSDGGGRGENARGLMSSNVAGGGDGEWGEDVK